MTKPYWYPVLCDEEYFASLRSDYPEKAHLSDDALHEYYNNGLKYQNLWDHVGDAYEDYEPMADAFLDMVKFIQQTRNWVSDMGHQPMVDACDDILSRVTGD